MKTILVITHTAIDNDGRIIRQVQELSKENKVILCCKNSNEERLTVFNENVSFIIADSTTYSSKFGRRMLNLLLKKNGEENKRYSIFVRRFLQLNVKRAYELYRPDLHLFTRKILATPNLLDVDAVVANDVLILSGAIQIRKHIAKHRKVNIPLIGDMHEVHMEYGGKSQTDDKIRKWACRSLLKQCDQIITVSKKIATLYEHYNRSSRPVMIVRNIPPNHELPAREPSGNKIKLVHLGNAIKQRGIIKHIDLLKLLDPRFSLSLYLVTPTKSMKQHLEELKQYIVSQNLEDRVKILTPVKASDVVTTLHQYDIGIYYLKPIVNNQVYSLPNKFFEYIQAKLGVVVTPIESMAELTNQYKIGEVAEDFELENFAHQVLKVADNLMMYKRNSIAASKELNAESEWGQLINYLRNN